MTVDIFIFLIWAMVGTFVALLSYCFIKGDSIFEDDHFDQRD